MWKQKPYYLGMTNEQIKETATDTLDKASWAGISLRSIATIGYKGELALPADATADDRFNVLNAIQDEAKTLLAGVED